MQSNWLKLVMWLATSNQSDLFQHKGSFTRDKKCMRLWLTVVVQKIRTFSIFCSTTAACGWSANFVAVWMGLNVDTLHKDLFMTLAPGLCPMFQVLPFAAGQQQPPAWRAGWRSSRRQRVRPSRDVRRSTSRWSGILKLLLLRQPIPGNVAFDRSTNFGLK